MILRTATGLAFVSCILVAWGAVKVVRPPVIAGSHDLLRSAQLINLTGAVGPESLAFDTNGDGPYTGVADGRILKWHATQHAWLDFAVTSSQREFISSVLSGDKTGRLLRYDRSSKEVTVLLRGLAFANGVALSKDCSFVLVAETTLCRISRFWLQGPNAGKVDTFAELPGFPDNIRRNSNGEFWVALHAKKGLLTQWMTSYSWLGKTLLKLPTSFKQLHYLLVGGKAHATAIKLSEKGEVLEVLEDIEGKTLRYISEVEEKNGKLWIGSVLMPFLGVYSLN